MDLHDAPMKPVMSHPQLIDKPEAARMLGGICPRTLANLMSRGKLGFVKVGRRTLFDVADIAEFIERNKRKPTGWKNVHPKRPVDIHPHVG